jgi:predicted molibdopterin-dependent oxidoreductase YjgC
VQRLHRSIPPPGDARPGLDLVASLLERLGAPLGARSPREVFALVARAVPAYAGFDYKALGTAGRIGSVPGQEARV